MHKAQVINIVTNQLLYIYQKTNTNRIPGLELVAISRANNINYLATGNRLQDTSTLSTRKIGTTPVYEKRRKYVCQIHTDSGPSHLYYLTAIIQFDITESVKTIDGGYFFD